MLPAGPHAVALEGQEQHKPGYITSLFREKQDSEQINLPRSPDRQQRGSPPRHRVCTQDKAQVIKPPAKSKTYLQDLLIPARRGLDHTHTQWQVRLFWKKYPPSGTQQLERVNAG